jgi:hypothetical protein
LSRLRHRFDLAITSVLLDAFGPIWQDRPSLAGVPLGDCWIHPALEGSALEDST